MAEKHDRERVPVGIARTLRAAWLSGRVGGSYLRAKITGALTKGEDLGARRERHTENAARIAETLAALRGPLMKIGQVLSTHAQALPPEYAPLLATLHASAPPMRFDTICAVLEQDLGQDVGAAFAELSEDAVAAASLGQVHRGRLHDGTEVAVKVQYPGAEESVKSDLSSMHAATAMMKRLLADLLGQTRFDVTPIAEEIAAHLLQETDYCREAYNAKLLAALFEGDDEIVVPRVHDAASGLYVVTYDWIEGEPLERALVADDPARRARLAGQLLHAFWHQLFRGGVLHADPHPGNFLVTPDGRLAILDYGCVKVFDEAFVRAFGDMLHASFADDVPRLRASFVALGLMDDPKSEDELEDMLKLAAYFAVPLKHDAVFDFARWDYVAAGHELVMHFLRKKRPPPAARDFIFLTRVTIGFYDYLSRSGATFNVHRAVMPYVEGGFRGRTIVIPPYG